jgi:methylphosphotriester-DNA--protein-cysteine methyltransferase
MRRNASDPLDLQKWNAVQKGDPTFDGVFFYGVRSTGIYCRPSCRSKMPLRKNVEFFDSAEKAEERGFRPCKRCKPDLSEQDRENTVVDLLKSICDPISTTVTFCPRNWKDSTYTRTVWSANSIDSITPPPRNTSANCE